MGRMHGQRGSASWATDRRDGYHGIDRRGLIGGRPPGVALTWALVGSTVFACVLLAAAMTATLPDGSHLASVQGQLEVAACAFALLVAVLCHLRWRLVGDAAAAWLTPALALWAVTAIADALLLSTDVAGGEAIRWLRWGGLLTSLALASRALTAPMVDARIRPRRLFLGSVASVLAAAGLGTTVAALLGQPGIVEGRAIDVVLSVAWLLVGAGFVVRGRREGRSFLGWIGVLLLLFAYGHLLVLVPASSESIAHIGSRVLEVAGLLAAVVGATTALAQAYLEQSGRLLQAETQKRTAEARVQEDLARDAERAHEARNALTAIEGATRALQAYSDQLREDDREALTAAVSAEIARLQRLVGNPQRGGAAGRFRVAEAIAAVVTCQRSLGAWIVVEVPDELVAVGSPTDTAEVVQNLLQNAHRYAGGRITISAALDGNRVAIRVADEGPGVDRHDRERIFERGVRGRGGERTEGSGLGLYVSARLMQEQGGDLRVEDRNGAAAGACFVAELPGFAETSADGSGLDGLGVGGQVDDQRQQVPEPAAGGRLFLVAGPQDTDGAAVLAEHDDAARDELAR